MKQTKTNAIRLLEQHKKPYTLFSYPVSDGKIDKNSAEKIIESRERKNAGATAPAQGLFLNKVFY